MLDQPESEEEYKLKVYPLKNQLAKDLASTLDNFVKQISRIERAAAAGPAVE